jgi:mono/diheme cytochrome c family protein
MSQIQAQRFSSVMLLASTAALAMTACGGGGGSNPLASANVLRGLAVDGYLQGATVYLDVNRNGVQDAGEPSTTTDTNGRYALDYSGVTGNIAGLSVIVTGGVDADTGFAFAGKLSAAVASSSQSQVVTPLTSLVHTMVQDGHSINVTEAEKQVASTLGLTPSQLSTDPTTNPDIYAKAVTVQRAIQTLGNANAQPGENSHDAQKRVLREMARAVRAQNSTVTVSQLVASLPLQNTREVQQMTTVISQSLNTALNTSGQSTARAALKAMDEVRVRMESDKNYSLQAAAEKIEAERGKTTSQPYTQLIQNSSNPTVVRNIQTVTGQASTGQVQPANTTGRLLASNCFQCHGTGGMGGFERIRNGESDEIYEYLSQSASGSIMAAHAQGYTAAQLRSIISYLQQ